MILLSLVFLFFLVLLMPSKCIYKLFFPNTDSNLEFEKFKDICERKDFDQLLQIKFEFLKENPHKDYFFMKNTSYCSILNSGQQVKEILSHINKQSQNYPTETIFFQKLILLVLSHNFDYVQANPKNKKRYFTKLMAMSIIEPEYNNLYELWKLFEN